jgi:hypothetical protein
MKMDKYLHSGNVRNQAECIQIQMFKQLCERARKILRLFSDFFLTQNLFFTRLQSENEKHHDEN